MITLEQIKNDLTELRKEKAPQVSDRWINETAEKFLAMVTEETNYEEFIKLPKYLLEANQLSINTAFAEEAKKNPKPTTNPKPTPTPNPNPQVVELPEEYKKMFETFTAEQKQKQINAKKEQIFNSAKGKFNDSQQAILKTVIDKFSFDFDQPDDVLQNTIITETTNFIKATIGEVDPQKPDNKNGDGDLAAEYAKKAEQYGLIPTTNN